MKALMKIRPGEGNVTICDIPEPVCGDDDVKVDVRFTGICGTDLHVLHDTFRNYPPVILGHEFSGTVVETGRNIKDIHVGDRVAVLGSNKITCGTCEFCMTGMYMFCPEKRGMGHGTNGSFTRYVTVREDQCYKLPENISFKEGALAEPFACAVQAAEELTKFNVGDTVLIMGPGPIGLMCLALIAAHGCRTVVAGTSKDAVRLAKAKEMGADYVVDVSKENPDDFIRRLTNGRGCDVVLDASGSQAGIRQALSSVKKLGRYIQVGISGKDVTVNFDTILYKQLQVYGCNGHSRTSWEHVFRIFETGKVNLKPLISGIMPLSQWQEAFRMCEEKEAVKILLYYDDKENDTIEIKG